MMNWWVTVEKSYISLQFEFGTIDDVHAFLEVFFGGLTTDDKESVRVSVGTINNKKEGE